VNVTIKRTQITDTEPFGIVGGIVSVTTTDIKYLRELTGAGILDCKKVLQETDGDVDQAVELLRKKGLAVASKKASREANEGLVSASISANGKVGTLVEVNCETDFVARTDDFKNFVDSIVRQVSEQPDLGRVEALLAAPYIGDPGTTVAEQLTETIAKLGENMVIRRIARFDSESGSILDSYIHPGARVGVLVEVSGGNGSDDQLYDLAHDIALQIAAVAPQYITEDDIPEAAAEAERNIYRAQIAADNKPDDIKERIVEGKLKKWYSQVTLVDQEFVKDSDLTVGQLLKQKSLELGGDIKVHRFARFELGVTD
jgi:elongation factor Ts